MIRTHTSKLSELRLKTDRQLVELISRTLDRGLEAAANGSLRTSAEQASCEARRLLPMLPHLDRRRIEPRLQRLEDLLYPHEQACCF